MIKDKTEEVKYCKDKNCKKVLPAGYKYKYCEACRNKRIDIVRNSLKPVLVLNGAFIVSLIGNKVNSKKK